MFDKLDQKLLALLQDDASRSLEVLADAVGLSRNACWRRVQRLQQERVITATVALADPRRLRLPLSVFIIVRTSQHTAEWTERFRAAIADLPEIVGAYRTAGDIDYLLHARVADVAAYDALYQQLTRKVAMTDVSATFVMEEMKHTVALPVGGLTT
jgi:Lrp/AsnC family transcriptional regulator